MAEQVVEVRFGGEQTEFISLSVRGRAYRQQQRQEHWDGNWLLVTVTIRVGKFSGEVPGLLRADELETFTAQFHDFLHTLKGIVTFQTAEDWLNFNLEADQSGKVEISGTLSDDIAYPYNSLKFTITVDQRFLAEPFRQLRRVTETFPVVGKP